MTNTDIPTDGEVVTEVDFLHRETIQIRLSKAEHKSVLFQAVMLKLQQDGVDTSIVAELPADEISYQIIDGIVFLYLQEPWPEGYSVADAMAAAAANAEGTTGA